jgi:hypothetical protein
VAVVGYLPGYSGDSNSLYQRKTAMKYLFSSALLFICHFAIAAPCDSEAHQAFDFWLGNWQVYKADGSLAGQNLISKDYRNCVLRERYSTPGGFTGESLNIYDQSRGVWHQSWVDNSGTLLLLEGNIVAGVMVLSGNGVTEAGKPQQHKISWTPNPDGSVRQHWQAKVADSDWVTVFDGLYKKINLTP